MWKYQCRLLLLNIAESGDIPICLIRDRLFVHMCVSGRNLISYCQQQYKTSICKIIPVYKIVPFVGKPCHVLVPGRHDNNSLMVLFYYCVCHPIVKSEQQMVRRRSNCIEWRCGFCFLVWRDTCLWKLLNFNFCGQSTFDIYTLLLGFFVQHCNEVSGINEHSWLFLILSVTLLP